MAVDRKWVLDRLPDRITSRGLADAILLEDRVDESGARVRQVVDVDDFVATFGDANVASPTSRAADALLAANKRSVDGKVVDHGYASIFRKWEVEGRFAADDKGKKIPTPPGPPSPPGGRPS